MKIQFYYSGSMMISCIFFAILSTKYNWSTNLWTKINKKVKSNWHIAIWLIGNVLFQLSIEVVLKLLAVNANTIDLITGLTMGLAFSFMPFWAWGKNKRKVDR